MMMTRLTTLTIASAADLLVLGSTSSAMAAPSDAEVGAAHDDILKKIGECTGTHQPASDHESENQGGVTSTLTNVTRKAKDGSSFASVRSQTSIAGAEGFTSHPYLTPKAIAAADRLTVSLGDLWRTS